MAFLIQNKQYQIEKIIKVKIEYNSLDSLHSYLKKVPAFECTKEYDSWDVRTNTRGHVEQCLVIKKSAMHGMKGHFENENKLKMTYIIPNNLMHAYFGKSEKAHRNIIEIITGKTKDVLLAPAQELAAGISKKQSKKVFENITANEDKVLALINLSYLNEKTKRNYAQTYQTRLKKLLRP